MYCSHRTEQSKNTAQTCCFIATNQNATFRQAKKLHYFLFFASLNINLSTCLFIQLKLIVQCLNSKTEEKHSTIFGFSSKMGKRQSCKVGFDILPQQALNLAPLAQEVDHLPTWAEVHDISWVLHRFDVALPNQHFTY